jgi:hypothetical protein
VCEQRAESNFLLVVAISFIRIQQLKLVVYPIERRSFGLIFMLSLNVI